MNKLFWILLISCIFGGCNVLDEKPECEENNTFSLEIINSFSDPYEIFINNISRGVIAGKKKVTLDVPAGFIKITAKQNSGYLLYPTVLNYERTSSACENVYLVIPQ